MTGAGGTSSNRHSHAQLNFEALTRRPGEESRAQLPFKFFYKETSMFWYCAPAKITVDDLRRSMPRTISAVEPTMTAQKWHKSRKTRID